MSAPRVPARSALASLLVAAAALATMVAACTRPVDVVASFVDASDASDAGALDAGEVDAANAPDAGPTPTYACATVAPITVLTGDGRLAQYDPQTSKATVLGTLECADAFGKPLALATDDAGMVYVLYDDGVLAQFPPGLASPCKVWGKPPVPLPAGEGAGLAASGERTLVLGAEQRLYAATTDPSAAWTQIGKLDVDDRVRALAGTGDGRLFGVLAPDDGEAYRVTSLAAGASGAGATLLVPAASGSTANPAGFALYADELLVLSEGSVIRYAFATGTVSAPVLVPELASVLAATSPPCASTL